MDSTVIPFQYWNGLQLYAKIPAMHAVIAPPEAGAELQATSYPIKLHLRYEVMAEQEVLYRGEGRTIAMSRTGVVFEASDRLPIGTMVQLYIEWPVKLENRIHLTLALTGKTIQGQHITVEILRHEFRIRARSRSAT